MNQSSLWLSLSGILVSALVAAAAFFEQPLDGVHALDQAFKAGNFNDAYQGFRSRALDPRTRADEVPHDLQQAIQCLQRLGRVDEVDDFREQVIAVHAQNWRLLAAAADSYLTTQHQGFLVAGRYVRGQKRGGGEAINSYARDRIRALQLLVEAMPLVDADPNAGAKTEIYLSLAEALFSERNNREAWRLQYLSNIKDLPDYDQGWYGGRSTNGAPVAADGTPIYYTVPGSFDAAEDDGQRWRWALARVAELTPNRTNDVRLKLARFYQSQFGVQTLANQSRLFGRAADDRLQANTGVYALDSLAETETIAQLANGIRRFTLPDEFNYIKIYQQIIAEPQTGNDEAALAALADEFTNRRQYPRSAEYWRTLIQKFGPENNRPDQLAQIVGNWGRFEEVGTQPAGEGATINFRFRNGKAVHFEAHSIRVEKLLADVKTYLKSRPREFDWQKANIGDIGYQLVDGSRAQYVGERVAAWDLALEPRAGHFDRRITVNTPLKKAGAYLLTAKMADGNTSNIVLWVADASIVRKPMANSSLYYMADAVTGQPLAGAKVDLFGFQIRQPDGRGRPQVDMVEQSFVSDAAGQVQVPAKEDQNGYSWVATAKTAQGRFAYLGFTNAWYRRFGSDGPNDETKVFTITDRPVYRPAQEVHYKFWVRQARYDEEGSKFAGQAFTLKIYNPRGEAVVEQSVTADDYGGIAGDYRLPADAMLGVYQLQLEGRGGSSFRVEEYKKPEYEVTIEAPQTPVMLGDKITAKIQARYYFGSPVTQAKVHYKVLRSSYSERWYPLGKWDWLYGPGYWWFAPDATWYPGWRNWSCPRPILSWWPQRHEQPEVVAEADTQIGPDGTVTFEIDTTIAKELHGDQDQQYTITAEVVDDSRRTIVGEGKVLVARKPFQVFAWVDRGYYEAGGTIRASFSAHTLDRQPVTGKGKLTLYKVSYDAKRQAVEESVGTWELDPDAQGEATQQLTAGAAGQYRLAYQVTDAAGHAIEGGYLFTVRGAKVAGANFRYEHLELIPDAREYQPGGKVRLLINSDRADATVLLFVRPKDGTYPLPKMVRLQGKSAVEEIDVAQGDMPNFFVEALTVSDGAVHVETREIVVPPESRVLDVAVTASAEDYKPGADAEFRIKLVDSAGKPFVGSTVVTVFDKSVEYISGGSNVPNIKEFFWKWRRYHNPTTETSLAWGGRNLPEPNKPGMGDLGMFGGTIADEQQAMYAGAAMGGRRLDRMSMMAKSAMPAPEAAPMEAAGGARFADGAGGGAALVQPTVRTQFADTALWAAALTTGPDGTTTVRCKLPENLTTWKVQAWGLGSGTRVGQGVTEVVTRKNLLVRLQAPRFFVETDEVVLSANVHNYLSAEKEVQVALELDGGVLRPLDETARTVKIAAGGEQRIDWRVRVDREGEAVVRMKALTDEESDAVEMRFPAYVHGMLKTESFAGALRPDENQGRITIRVPEARRPNESRLEVRYSPTLAGAVVDALPYLVDYPYGCTEQTLNRFVPTVVAQHVLLEMKVNLAAVRDKRANLNAQELGDPQQRAAGGGKRGKNPVFDQAEVTQMVTEGVQALVEMQMSDGGWGWFSGWGERSSAHTTATVVHGLQLASANGAAVPGEVLARGVAWLTQQQDERVQELDNAATKTKPYVEYAGEIDALVYSVLVEAGTDNAKMRDYLYRDRTRLSVYGEVLLGLALQKTGQAEQLAMVLKNIEQFLVQDNENQTAYLRLPEGNAWWLWYGSDVEAMAGYLKLLVRTQPQSDVAARLAKYLINNRRHATYWNSTRDTALCVEALAEYCLASGEAAPDMVVEVWIDGIKRKEVPITAAELFSYDDRLILEGAAVETGEHTIELRKRGRGPLYYNAYLTNFTLEDPITATGLEIKVARSFYKLVPVEATAQSAGTRGQALQERVEKFARQPLADLNSVESGDRIEVELTIDSKNDYEYLLFEDFKAAGFEAIDVRSGYTGNALGAYVEFRDNRVAFFVRSLARGQHSVSYRLRAETPGKFSALPARGAGMYAPELTGNSAEFKVLVVD